MKNDSYFVKEYPYHLNNYGDLTGSSMKIWDGDEPYYFFLEVAKSLYNYLMQRHRDLITIIVWNGVLYEYINPDEAFSGVFVFRSIYGKERRIDLSKYISDLRYKRSA